MIKTLRFWYSKDKKVVKTFYKVNRETQNITALTLQIIGKERKGKVQEEIMAESLKFKEKHWSVFPKAWWTPNRIKTNRSISKYIVKCWKRKKMRKS